MNFFKYQDFLSSNRGRATNSTVTGSSVSISSSEPRQNKGDPRNAPQAVYDTTSDEQWIQSWLQQNPIPMEVTATQPKSKTPVTQIPIIQAKSSLKNCLIILEKLNHLESDLQNNVDTMSSTDWKQKTVEIGHLKDQFTKLMVKFENADAVSYLEKNVRKRKKKRVRQKNSRKFKAIQSQKNAEKRLMKDVELDHWLVGMKEEAEKAKMEENMKKDADCVLAEVTKKKSEARKHLSLISALVKLRSVRETMYQHRGEKTSLEDRQAFNITTEKLVKMWENALKVYSTEEQGLRLMLEKNAEDDTKAAKLAKEKKLLEEWQEVLFGPKHLTPVNNQIYWALTVAERDLETFVAIRKSWDTFLVPHSNEAGSNIPIGWVLPDANPQSDWTRYLQH